MRSAFDRRQLMLQAAAIIAIAPIQVFVMADEATSPSKLREKIPLVEPRDDGSPPLGATLRRRRSVREFSDKPLQFEEVSQIAWAAQGITHRAGFRTAPSAGALYPLEMYVIAGNVTGLEQGVYKYGPVDHMLRMTGRGDRRSDISRTAFHQKWIQDAAAIFVLAAVFERTTIKYDRRGIRYVYMEAGHAAQNVCLQAVALGLGATTVGAFNDDALKAVVGMAPNEDPLSLLPIGRLG